MGSAVLEFQWQPFVTADPRTTFVGSSPVSRIGRASGCAEDLRVAFDHEVVAFGGERPLRDASRSGGGGPARERWNGTHRVRDRSGRARDQVA